MTLQQLIDRIQVIPAQWRDMKVTVRGMPIEDMHWNAKECVLMTKQTEPQHPELFND